MPKKKFLGLTISVITLYFCNLVASNNQNNPDIWSNLTGNITTTGRVNSVQKENIKKYCDELTIDPSEFLDLVEKMKMPSSEANLDEQVLLAQCLIKFCPPHQLTNKFVISIFKKDSSNKSAYSSLMKCAINTAQNLMRGKQKQVKSQKEREKASMNLQANEENLIALKDIAEQNRNVYSQRLRKEFDAKLYQILLTLSSLTKLNEDYLLIMMNTDVQNQINLELREKTPEEKQQAIFMERVNPNIIKRMSDPISLQTLFEFYCPAPLKLYQLGARIL